MAEPTGPGGIVGTRSSQTGGIAEGRPPRLLLVGATGWFGLTLIHEYLTLYGRENAGSIALYGSRRSTLRLTNELSDVVLAVEPLSMIRATAVDEFDCLVWYAFLLRNRIDEVGLRTYRQVNDEIAEHVFHTLARAPALRCVFASSGAVFDHDRLPDYEVDPYSHLKLVYESRLRETSSDVSVVYPYASTGAYLPVPYGFALGSFIEQALTEGRIVVDAAGPVLRSYGSVHDLSRYLLALLGGDLRLPAIVVPATVSLDLSQLAVEVCVALGLPPDVSTRMRDVAPNVYLAQDFEYVRQLAEIGLRPTALADQIRLTARGPAFARIR